MRMFAKFKQALFPKGLKRSWARYRNRAIQRTREDDFAEAFERLGLPAGSTLVIHARLSSFGHLADGPESVIRALRRVVPDSTVVMPTFPFSRTMVEYFDTNAVFDPAMTPSQSGVLSEAFRRMPGVRRSIHPTHPCAALGPQADAIIDGSEDSLTPFGPNSAYGRATRSKDAYQLLLDTNSSSIVHVIQERIGMPNLFLDSMRQARGLMPDGRERQYNIWVHLPKIPLYVAVPIEGGIAQYLWMPDYCLLFPRKVRDRTLGYIKSEEVRVSLIERDAKLLRDRVLRVTPLRSAEILAMHTQPWLDTLCAELSQNITRYRELYTPEKVNP